MSDLQTLAANLRHAARTGKPAMIGGGEYSPAECAALAESIGQLLPEMPGAAFCVKVAGYPVALFQTGRDSYRVQYGADVKTRLAYSDAALEIGLSVMHGLALSGKLEGAY